MAARVRKVSVFELLKYLIRDEAAKQRLIERLVKHLEPTDDGHLLYKGAVNNNGYAKINSYHPDNPCCQVYVHELFACLKRGCPISEGYEVDHKCDIRTCVAHLVDKTKEDNKARRKHATGTRQAKHPSWRKRQTGGRQSLPG